MALNTVQVAAREAAIHIGRIQLVVVGGYCALRTAEGRTLSEAFLGIDVGTGSARAGIFDGGGRLLASSKRDITIWHEANSVAEQSSTEIWEACCSATRAAVKEAGVTASDIRGIGVDATCSLVVVDSSGAPLSVGSSGDSARNVIVWMDHRAIEQAQRINSLHHDVLDYVGGQISVEMQTPKLLWLKENKPDSFHAAGHFLDLSDFLTWQLTGDLARSACTVTCKWTYLSHEKRWDASFFDAIGLEELTDDFTRIGTRVVDPATSLGRGLSPQAAMALGLREGTPVGAALIDAHAGGLGTVGAQGIGPAETTLAYIFGTSACAMASSRNRTFVPGVWGPYFSVMIPGMWLNEAGQSAAGAAIDYLVEMHPAVGEARQRASGENMGLNEWLGRCAVASTVDLSDVALRAGVINLVPDFNGNRSPFADPNATGIMAGIRLDRSLRGLVDLYVAGLCALGYGLGQIIAALQKKGVTIENIVVSGGAAQSSLTRQLLADTTGHAVAIPENQESVLLGAAMLGAVAAGRYPSLTSAMAAMSRIAAFCRPKSGPIATFHQMKARAYMALQDVERKIRGCSAHAMSLGACGSVGN